MALSIPDFEAYLQSLGVGQANDSGTRYMGDVRLSQGRLDEMMGNELTDYQRQQISGQGYVPLSGYSDKTMEWLNENYGTNFGSGLDYAKYLYGDGQVEVGPDGQQYFKTPNGVDQYVNAPMTYVDPDKDMSNLVKMGLIGLAGAGLGGFLPGVEGIFGAGAGGAGAAADAAWGVNAAGGAGTAAGEFSLAGGLAPGAGIGGVGSAGLGLTPGVAGSTASGLGLSLGAGGAGSALLSPSITGGATGLASAVAPVAASWGVNPQSAGSALGNIFGGNGGPQDYASVLGSAGAAGLGIAGANAQADAYSDVADKYLALGAPYRQKLEASYAPGFSMADQPDFMNALDLGAQAAARATSARSGNPVDNPGAYAEMQKYISGSLALPQLNTYRSQLGSFGQLGTNTAGTNDTAAAGQTGGMYNAAGYGLGQLTQPKNPYEDAMKGLLGQFKLNQGFSFA